MFLEQLQENEVQIEVSLLPQSAPRERERKEDLAKSTNEAKKMVVFTRTAHERRASRGRSRPRAP